MGTLLLTLLPLLLVDVINPVLFAAGLYVLGTRNPIRSYGLLLFSFGISYFIAGIVIALGLDALGEWMQAARDFDYAIEFVVALLLLYMGLSQIYSGDSHPENALHCPDNLHPSKVFWLGVQVNIVGLPFALPYLAAIDQIMKAEMSDSGMAAFLIVYNLLYLVPFVALLLVKLVYNEASQPLLQKAYRCIHRISNRWLPWIFILLGLLLLEDCISYFLGYREYSFMSLYT